MKKDNTIKRNSKVWDELLRELHDTFRPGELIPHEWFFDRFHIEDIRLSKNQIYDPGDFAKKLQEQSFELFALINIFRLDLLRRYNICLQNVYSKGYTIVPATEQVRYGYDQALSGIRKSLRNAKEIMTNVDMVPAMQQAKDDDLRCRIAWIEDQVKKAANMKNIFQVGVADIYFPGWNNKKK